MSISELQTYLNQLGVTPPLVVDGVWGPKTQAALLLLLSKLGDNTGVPSPFLAAVIKVLADLGYRPLEAETKPRQG